MNIGIWVYAILVTISLLFFVFVYVMHRREVMRLSKKVEKLLKNDTHVELNTEFPTKDMEELVTALNGLLVTYREQMNMLQKKDETIKETITNLAHDLRTPMTAMQGYTKMLMESAELSEEDRMSVNIIHERLLALNCLLNQLFEFARIEAEELEICIDTVDLNAIFRSVAVSFYAAFEARGLEPHIEIADVPFLFWGDEKAITRIFENVISNALAHGISDYRFSSYMETQQYTFVFQNVTKDIKETDIDKIFERFYTTDQSRSKKTTGLGLTIAKKLTTRMGGSIRASLKDCIFEIKICFPFQ